ncbi:MAG: phospho-N-acetylmuramoyl-pentapeptide-transferase [Candidatus Marinimicrobia bacterium]|nr:phospho-N-acetylmuramoyl-pentapeptide-transferase [Candidatus Neomarinimicrobiota bacterium]MBT7524277.1 phospho-N-acetylmuramoyl-pentapeptide-transferase [Candidatus Neomarinimicrobiota bacterium]MDG2366469.1 phospho-N-acetylmuramoyl-pentapeptide-transferase [Candidatus Neomarinimicrobiota bacterium]
MLYHLLYPLKDFFSPLNIFQYITFRSSIAAIMALLISFLLGPVIIRKLKELQIGEEIRDFGPESHLKKKGTPTMGGLIILSAIILPTFLLADLNNPFIEILLISTIWMGLIGFIDDYLKSVKKIKKGLIARYKLSGQILLGMIITFWIYNTPAWDEIRTVTSIPFLKDTVFDFGLFYPLMILLVVAGTSNAVNLTDGLDGLATGLLAISFSVFAVIAYISGRVDFSDYLNIIYLPGAGELTIFSAACVGACLGYLWFNAAPAEVFMGDIGSLSTGAALGTLAILLKKEFLLIIIGGVFVAEAISVILQVGYFRYTKKKYGEPKKLFLMAPFHHHFELKGWPESQVVIRFWIIGLLLALLTIATFKIR